MISVCMATYNGEQYLREQIDSILAQLGSNDELIISDDNSTDSTRDIVKSYSDPRITLLINNRQHFKWNFLNALTHSRGEYIFLADQDDVWLPGKVSACSRLLENCDMVVTDSIITDEQLNVIEPSFFTFYHSGKGILKNIVNNTYFGTCMAFRRSVLNAALPFPETIEIGHDLWLGLVAETMGNVKFLKQPYIYYRRHDAALTNIRQSLLTRSKRSLWTKIKGRLIVLKTLLKERKNIKAKAKAQC